MALDNNSLQELNRIKTNGSGGFTLDQTINALKVRLKENKQVRVIGGHETRQESQLRRTLSALPHDQERFFVFPYALNPEHQIAIVIDHEKHQFRIYDHNQQTRLQTIGASGSDEYNLKNQDLKNLANMFTYQKPIAGDSSGTQIAEALSTYEIVDGYQQSPYSNQKNDWECGVLAVLGIQNDIDRHIHDKPNPEMKSYPDVSEEANAIYLDARKQEQSFGPDPIYHKIENLHRTSPEIKKILDEKNIDIEKVIRLVESSYHPGQGVLKALETFKNNLLKELGASSVNELTQQISQADKEPSENSKKVINVEKLISLIENTEMSKEEYLIEILKFAEDNFSKYLVDTNQDAFTGTRKGCFKQYLNDHMFDKDFQPFLNDFVMYMGRLMMCSDSIVQDSILGFPPQEYNHCFTGLRSSLHTVSQAQFSDSPLAKSVLSAHNQFISVQVGDLSRKIPEGEQIHIPVKVDNVLGVSNSLTEEKDHMFKNIILAPEKVKALMSEYPQSLKEYVVENMLANIAIRLKNFDPNAAGFMQEYEQIMAECGIDSKDVSDIYTLEEIDEDTFEYEFKLELDNLVKLIAKNLHFGSFENINSKNLEQYQLTKNSPAKLIAKEIKGDNFYGRRLGTAILWDMANDENQAIQFINVVHALVGWDFTKLKIGDDFLDIKQGKIIELAQKRFESEKGYIHYLKTGNLPESPENILQLIRSVCMGNCPKNIFDKISSELIDKIDCDLTDEFGCTAMHYAAAYGDKEFLEKLLINGGSITAQNNQGNTPLFLAFQHKNEDIIKVLLDKTDDVSLQNKEGDTLLHIAVDYGNKEFIENVMSKGASVDIQNKKGNTPLLLALEQYKYNIAKNLIDSTNNINLKTKTGIAALHYAIKAWDNELVKIIMEKNPNVNLQVTRRGARALKLKTPLHIAAQSKNLEVVRMLLEKDEIKVNLLDERKAPVHYAATDENPNNIMLFLNHDKVDLEFKEKFTGNTTMHIAAKNKNPEIAKLLLDSNRVNVKATNRRDETILHKAADNENPEVIQLLLSATKGEVDINATDNRLGNTVLHIAASNPNVEIAKAIFANTEIDETIINKLGMTPLHIAAQNSNHEVLDLFLKRQSYDLNAKTENGQSPLHLAAQNQNPHVLRLLLENEGVNRNSLDDEGGKHPPIYYAAKNPNPEVMSMFLADSQVDVSFKDKNNNSILHLAAQSKLNPEVVKRLLQDGRFDVNSENGLGQTALHLSLSSNNKTSPEGFIKVILEEEKVNINAQNNRGNTALHSAANYPFEGRLNCMQALLAHNDIDCNIKNQVGNTPLHIAAKFGKLDSLKALLAHNDINCNIKNQGGNTPLHLAMIEKNPDIPKVLLAHNDINCNVKNQEGNTPLHLAILEGKPGYVKALLDSGKANIKLKSSDGYTPLHLAILKDNTKMVKMLLDNGANINTRCNGKTALQCAIESNSIEMVQIISTAKSLERRQQEATSDINLGIQIKNKKTSRKNVLQQANRQEQHEFPNDQRKKVRSTAAVSKKDGKLKVSNDENIPPNPKNLTKDKIHRKQTKRKG